MADGKIYIMISDTRGGSGAGVSNAADTGDKKSSKKSLAKFAQHQFFHLIDSEAKQIVNYTVGNIGNFTGNYEAQREIQTDLLILNKLINFGSSVAGSYTLFGGGPSGIAAAAITATAITVTEGVSLGLQYVSGEFERKKTNRNLAMIRNRLGLQGLTNGSRTGGY